MLQFSIRTQDLLLIFLTIEFILAYSIIVKQFKTPKTMLDYLSFEIDVEDNFQPTKHLREWNQSYSKGVCLWKKYHLPNRKDDHYLEVRYIPSRQVIRISGSIRKWYFGSTNLKDLQFEEILECLGLIADRLDFDFADLFSLSEVLNFEVGISINTKVPASKFLHALKMHGNSPRSEFRDSGVAFYKSNVKISFYDKIKEMSSGRGEFKLDKSVAKKFADTNNHFIRFELARLKPSGLLRLPYKGYSFSTVGDLVRNYDHLILLLLNQLDKLITSEAETHYATFPFDTISNKKDFREFCVYIGIKTMDKRNALQSLRQTKIYSKSKSDLKKEIIKIDKKFSDKTCFDFIKAFRNKVNEAIQDELFEYKMFHI